MAAAAGGPSGSPRPARAPKSRLRCEPSPRGSRSAPASVLASAAWLAGSAEGEVRSRRGERRSGELWSFFSVRKKPRYAGALSFCGWNEPSVRPAGERRAALSEMTPSNPASRGSRWGAGGGVNYPRINHSRAASPPLQTLGVEAQQKKYWGVGAPLQRHLHLQINHKLHFMGCLFLVCFTTDRFLLSSVLSLSFLRLPVNITPIHTRTHSDTDTHARTHTGGARAHIHTRLFHVWKLEDCLGKGNQRRTRIPTSGLLQADLG